MNYAGIGKRIVAVLIDTFLLNIAAIVVYISLILPLNLPKTTWLVACLIIQWLYWSLMESSRVQGTVGKMTLGLSVTNLEGNRVSFGRATGRYFLGRILFIGYILILLSERRQALHDRLAGCVVVDWRRDKTRVG